MASWADLAGRRVGIWGIGVEGRAVLAHLLALGVEPVLVDRDPGQVDGRPVLPEDGGALLGCDVVVKSPGISPLSPTYAALDAAGVTVTSALSLWLGSVDRERVVLVTGTKGKSTTASVAGHLATRLGRRAFVGGNIGSPPHRAPDPDGVDLWIIEVSSFQAADLDAAAPVVAVTALGEDHVDWHGSVDRYVADKLSICTKPGARVTVAGDDPAIRERAALLGPEVRWVGPDTWGAAWCAPLGLVGRHNVGNAAVARAALLAAGVDELADDAVAHDAARGFAALRGRYEVVAEVDGVQFVDDGLSTNVLPTLAALEASGDRRLALLVGGHDRGVDYAPLARALAGRTSPTLVLCLYEAGERILAAVGAEAPSPWVEARPSPSLDAAVREGWGWARPGGAVLLSPAAPSFGAFRNHTERSDAFRATVADLAGKMR